MYTFLAVPFLPYIKVKESEVALLDITIFAIMAACLFPGTQRKMLEFNQPCHYFHFFQLPICAVFLLPLTSQLSSTERAEATASACLQILPAILPAQLSDLGVYQPGEQVMFSLSGSLTGEQNCSTNINCMYKNLPIP